MVSQGCLSLIKYFLFLFNLFFFTLGLLLLSLGLWIVFDEVSFFMLAPSSLSLSVLSYFLAIGGTVTMAVGFFGCVGALKEVRCMLGMYFFLLTVLLAAQIVGGVIFFTQKTAFEDKVKEHVLQIITSIRKNNSSLNHFEKTLEYIQREVNCCGWNGPMDWGDDMVPCSCYQLPNSTVFEHLNQGMNNGSQKLCPCHSRFFPQNNTCNIYEQGCREGIKEWLEENVVIILGVLFAVVLVEVNKRISACLAVISIWMTRHHLKLNLNKTNLLFISYKTSLLQKLSITVDGTPVTASHSAVSLGVVLDDQLDFKEHIKATSCIFLVYNIRRTQPYLTTYSTQLLVQAMLTARLDYCNSL
ncbi:leukocyte antigen CD37 isoform X1 [Anguilla anguilla]|uniref:leukocyte antigen CD37 isoform X1 n=1 Tax=Anguilla anguilla TaxID=7936 RepID=UPI0015A7ADA4|nr:leukocyte antigen CD37 isoform X1 [Anguilla anguilla]